MKYLLWLYGGSNDYENVELDVIGMFSTMEKAQQAKQQAKSLIDAKLRAGELAEPTTDRRYIIVYPFGICTSFEYELNIEPMQEDTLKRI